MGEPQMLMLTLILLMLCHYFIGVSLSQILTGFCLSFLSAIWALTPGVSRGRCAFPWWPLYLDATFVLRRQLVKVVQMSTLDGMEWNG